MCQSIEYPSMVKRVYALPFVFFVVSLAQPSHSFVAYPYRTHHQTSMSSTKQSMTEIEYTRTMNANASEGAPFSDEELAKLMSSLNKIDALLPCKEPEIKTFLESCGHLSHKQWDVTSDNSKKLASLLGLDSENKDEKFGLSNHARGWLSRVIEEGKWDAAVMHGSQAKRPFAVLVTGVNGIRKTTALYQPWWQSLLAECLGDDTKDSLPSGQNSFFRQLDHMIATLCNQEFADMYSWMEKDDSEDKIPLYTDRKAAIFTRYRTLSELLGIELVRAAQKTGSNVMLETSGRDVAMFEYVDRFFDDSYQRLALHFQINDLRYAQASVDRRMKEELEMGVQAIQAGSVRDVILANQGGPYGSAVLPGVQEASDTVWEQVRTNTDSGVGHDWLKATIQINAHASEPWTAQAVRPDGSLGTVYTFGPRR